jgi:hypothetical protein
VHSILVSCVISPRRERFGGDENHDKIKKPPLLNMDAYWEGAALFGSAALIKNSIYHKAGLMSLEMFEKISES